MTSLVSRAGSERLRSFASEGSLPSQSRTDDQGPQTPQVNQNEQLKKDTLAEDDLSPTAIEPSYPLAALKVVISIVASMAGSALLIASILLHGSLILIGFCIAFLMMLFIGMPLILASIADVSDSQ